MSFTTFSGNIRNPQVLYESSKKSKWILSEHDFYTLDEIRKIKHYLEKERIKALNRSRKIPVKNWLVINLAFETGLRVSEIARLACGDLFLTEKCPFLIVRCGKYNKSRIVKLAKAFSLKLKWYLEWKQSVGESTDPGSPLIISSNTGKAISVRALQYIFKNVLNRIGIRKQNNIHMARHTYATHLLRANNRDIVFVKEQLGHSTIEVTQVYLHVIESDAQKALDRLNK